MTTADPAEYTDADLAEGNELGNTINAEILPDDPPTPLAQTLANHKTTPARYRRWSVRVRDPQGALVGGARISFDPEHDDDPDLFWTNVAILPHHRRLGVGTAVLAELVSIARTEGRVRLLFGTSERIPAGEAFATALGAEPRIEDHTNHLPIAEVDRDLLDRWVAEGPVRAEGYELMGWDDRAADEDLDRLVEIILVMNTAPRDDLPINDFTLTPAQIREWDDSIEAQGIETWSLVARRVSDGVWAGLHDVSFDPSNPQVAWIGMTGVQPEHRGHALGKWLKAAMTLRILDERPGVTEIRTGNADSNDAMLGINKEMGYRPMLGGRAWELTLDDAEAYLSARTQPAPV